jgi:PAS domain S-box-containing protein
VIYLHGDKADFRPFWITAIIISILIAIGSTIVSLTHGIPEIYPFLYFIPIILFVYCCPDKGVLFSLGISAAYILLVYILCSLDALLVAVSTAWFVIFVTFGVVTSSFAEKVKSEEEKYRSIFDNSQAAIFTFDPKTLTFIDANGKFTDAVQHAGTSLAGQTLFSVLEKNDEADAFLNLMRSTGKSGEAELDFLARDGSKRKMLVAASVTSGGAAVCSAVDITARWQADQLIRRAQEDHEERIAARTSELTKANEELCLELEERKRFERAIQLANKKLMTLSDITRHDILNQVSAIVMYLSLTREISPDTSVKVNLDKIEQITRMIQEQVRFAHDYQSIGSASPQWQDLGEIIRKSIGDVDPGTVQISSEVHNIEIFADLLLEKVFANLIDNSLVHGGSITRIGFSVSKRGDRLVIVCEDDGTGVPDAAKEKIFKREYYRNTGYGLFLSYEIFGITGITISENGEHGRGAHFEIVVPSRGYRFNSH